MVSMLLIQSILQFSIMTIGKQITVVLGYIQVFNTIQIMGVNILVLPIII